MLHRPKIERRNMLDYQILVPPLEKELCGLSAREA